MKYLSIFFPIILGCVLAVSENAWANGGFVLSSENVSLIEIEGRKGLWISTEFALPDSNEIDYCSLQISLDIDGYPDPNFGLYWINCYPWSIDLITYGIPSNSCGGYWVTSLNQFSVDVTKCIQINGSVGTINCLLGDFGSDSDIWNLGMGNEKSGATSCVNILSSPKWLKPEGGHYLAERPSLVNKIPQESVPSSYTIVASPNPFNPETKITFKGGNAQVFHGKVNIFDIRGRRVCEQSIAFEGEGHFNWNGLDRRGMSVSSGVYFVQLESDFGEKVASLPVVLIK